MLIFIIGFSIFLGFIGILDFIEDYKRLRKQNSEFRDENSKLIAYIDQNIGCATVCNDCHCGKKEMIE